ncbi:hypothetical protein [Streptomyces sp. CB02460]|uniref:hypothetical protein n=1 Tax=Streptomyces sp. CB02460 TaxID=1703941 RepID=UPI00093E3748|nr:hypothetical protein [Streptomyces sp. CB02460]OKJ73250.1 hypothetical protein AMK30_19790 [Streptomyces sp. CB02460]
MAERGHAGFPLDPRSPIDTVSLTVASTDYGTLDLASARRWGYGWDPAASRAQRPAGRRMTDAEYPDYLTCRTQSEQQLMRGIDVKRDWLYAGTREIEIAEVVKRDPDLREAWDEWGDCMADRGFTRYSDPVAAYTDAAWHRGNDGNTRHTQRERDTAVADVTCKRRLHTTEVWHTTRAREQAIDITRHRARYTAGLKALQTYRATITEVLRELG